MASQPPLPTQEEPCRPGGPPHRNSHSVLETSTHEVPLQFCQSRQIYEGASSKTLLPTTPVAFLAEQMSHLRLPGHPGVAFVACSELESTATS